MFSGFIKKPVSDRIHGDFFSNQDTQPDSFEPKTKLLQNQ